LDENHQLVLDATSVFAGQAYDIQDRIRLSKTLIILKAQSRNEVDFAPVGDIIKKYWAENDIIRIATWEYNDLNKYVWAIRANTTIYYSVLESMCEEQEEQMINIKLPDKKILDLSELNKFNNRIKKICDTFWVDGGFEFRWFDNGSDRYMFAALGVMTYRVFLIGLKIAKEFFETKKLYYESEKAKIDYKASLKQWEEETKKGFEEYQERRLNIRIDDKVKQEYGEITIKNGRAPVETQMVIAIKELIKELKEWTEFHLSLNPPEYARENGKLIEIDYKKLPKIEEETKALEDKEEKGVEDNNEE